MGWCVSDTLLVIHADPSDLATLAHTLQLAKETGHDVVVAAQEPQRVALAQAMGAKVVAGTTHHATVVAEGWSRPYGYVLELRPNGTPIPAGVVPAVRRALQQGLDLAGQGAVRGYERWALRA
jgi:D-arabinose 1-dehydrogenase-like Zn-dependent alcohol dehydrogenase